MYSLISNDVIFVLQAYVKCWNIDLKSIPFKSIFIPLHFKTYKSIFEYT